MMYQTNASSMRFRDTTTTTAALAQQVAPPQPPSSQREFCVQSQNTNNNVVCAPIGLVFDTTNLFQQAELPQDAQHEFVRTQFFHQRDFHNFEQQQQQQFAQLQAEAAGQTVAAKNCEEPQQTSDSISLALEEISAILNGKDFENLTGSTTTPPSLINNKSGNQNNTSNGSGDGQDLHQLTGASPQSSSRSSAAAAAYTEAVRLEADTATSIYSESLSCSISQAGRVGRLQTEETMAAEPVNKLSSSSQFAQPATNWPQQQQPQSAPSQISGQPPAGAKPFVEIVEQPAKCALRFRYKCEGRSAGSLPGLSSSVEKKTYPAIRIHNYVGRAVVVISCVTKDAPYRTHPHNIVGKEGCKKGICTVVIPKNEPDSVRSFSSLGIQCVKRKDIEESLSLRESINVDPFRNGFNHKTFASNIDLNVVRLCFQVFVEGSTQNKCDVPLTPIVSEPIHDKKAMSDLVITKLSHCSAPATGGREVILLCDRVSKDDIQIRFYEERDSTGELIWESLTDVAPADVHKQVAICFRTPTYYNENITQPVMVRVQLRRISDNQVSEPRLFQMLPCESDEDIISRKRQKIEWVNMNLKCCYQQQNNSNAQFYGQLA